MRDKDYSLPVFSNEKKIAAFFDLDNTIIKGSSFYYFVKGLVSKNVISRRQIARFGWENFRFIKSRQENTGTMANVTKRALHFVQGMSQSFLQHLSEEIVQEFFPQRALKVMQDRVLEHQLMKNETWLITAAPQELAEVIARNLNMSGAKGTEVSVENGVYRAELAGPTLHGPRKAEMIQRLANLHNFDLSRSFAYSDSVNDLPMLVSVGKPVVVNPEKELERIAIKNRWPIIESTLTLTK
jgi:HAD superfamily hydrolase (TIGR01490 family)